MEGCGVIVLSLGQFPCWVFSWRIVVCRGGVGWLRGCSLGGGGLCGV